MGSDMARLSKCVDAVRHQVDEVIISTDGNHSIEGKIPGVTVIPNPSGKRTGFGRTIMRGARHSNSHWLLLLNDDCILDSDAVSRMRECATPETAVVGCQLRFPDGRIQHGGVQIGPDGVLWGHLDYGQMKPSITTVVEMPGVTFAAALVRRKPFYALGGFDLRYDCYCEDADFCRTARDAGWKILYNPNAKGVHFESQSMSAMKLKLLSESRAKAARKSGLNIQPTATGTSSAVAACSMTPGKKGLSDTSKGSAAGQSFGGSVQIFMTDPGRCGRLGSMSAP
jgi:GT2 family glycosyltransferase